MKYDINNIPLLPGNQSVDGYVEIVDFHIHDTGMPGAYIVTFICDMHFPSPLGGRRVKLPYEFNNVSDVNVLEEFLIGWIARGRT